MSNHVQTKPLSPLGKIGRSILKRFMYSQLMILSGLKIAIGKENPLVRFTVENDPPSMYWIFRIRSSKRDELEKMLGLPEPFTLCRIQCLESDEPEYLLTINAYRVSGLANGMRAEWSVFIQDADHKPRYLIIDARSSTVSVDPIDIITKSSRVIHERKENRILTQIGEGDQGFRSTITLTGLETPITTSREWVSANDYIYWGNGICDRTFYDTSLANADQIRISGEQCDIMDGSVWSQFLEPSPVHVLMLQNAIEFVISPWENLDRIRTR